MLNTETLLARFRVQLQLRFTRISCRPLGASLAWSKVVQALDEADAVRQACLCVERELEDVLAQVNAINVSAVVVEVETPQRAVRDDDEPVWNPSWFGTERGIPRHVVVRRR